MNARVMNLWITLALFALCLGAPALSSAEQTAPSPMPSPATSTIGFFALYEQNRQQGVGNYITEDFLLLSYGMLLNEALTRFEEKELHPALLRLVQGLAHSVQGKTDATAKANAAYLSLLECILSGRNPAAGGDDDVVADELKLVREAKGLAPSPLMGQQIDYSQFQVRGKYTRNETLGRYFQAVKYAGTAFFPLKESKATGVSAARADLATAQALELAKAIKADKKLDADYRKFLDGLAWLVGPSEEVGLADYLALANKQPAVLRSALLAQIKKQNRLPRILSAAVDKNALEPGLTPAEAITGFRLLPQRATAESAAFQGLVWDQVGAYLGKNQSDKAPFTAAMIDGKLVKGFPMALELMALLGAKEAESILKGSGDREYKGYAAAAAKVKPHLAKTDTLPGLHLDLLRFWFSQEKSGQPDAKRRLNSSLGFWTYQRYINTLYAKQSYTVAGKGFPLAEGERASAWLEPAVALYERLGKLVATLRSHLPDERLAAFEKLVAQCVKIAATEQANKPLASADVAFLNNLDKELLQLTGGQDKPIVVDVHTESANAKVLEEGLGFARPVEKTVGQATLRGGLMQYYEFKQPMERRLSDAAWEEILRDPKQRGALSFSPGTLF